MVVMRKLLPYEQALIQELGITEEEYFAFRKAQREYTDPKAGTIFDIRNEPVGTVALVLSIIGTLASVGAALLAPRPDIPEVDAGGGNRRARDRRFAPRFGFDSLQDLAQYGVPVNLVYGQRGTEKTSINDALANPDGGVRVNTSLLWSAVYSYGNAQYIQMMAAIGAGEIVDIDYDLTAVGQTLMRLFRGGTKVNAANAAAWQYFRNSGPILRSDLKNGSQKDPLLQGVADSRTVYDPLINATVRSQGFSQAFSPSSASEFGISAPIPVKVNVFARNEKGAVKKNGVKIRMDNRTIWPDFYGSSRPLIAEGTTFNLVIDPVKDKRSDTVADDLADEIRLASAESIELGATYKLGSAKFQVTSVSGGVDLSRGVLNVGFTCIESGYGPWEDYQTEDIFEQEEELVAQEALYVNEIARLKDIRDNTRLSDFLVDNLPARQAKAFAAIESYTNQIEAIVDAITGYRRNISQLDELILEAEKIDTPFLGEEVRIFNRQVVALANEVNSLENYIEDQRNEIQGSKRGEKQEYRLAIRNAKSNLRQRRTQLAEAVKEYGVANGVVFDAMAGARALIKDVNNAMQGIVRVTPASIPDVASSAKPRAAQERKKLKVLRNFLRRVESLVSSALQYKNDEYNAYIANLNGYIAENEILLQGVRTQLADKNSFNDYLGTKCVTKINEASYETLSPVNLVHFSIKAKVFMRIQGRASKYGETDVKFYKDSDNGNKPRTAIFTVSYKKVGQDNSKWKSPNVFFCVRRAFDKDVFIPLIFRSPDEDGQSKWEFKFSPVHDPSSEALKRGALNSTKFVYLEARGPMQQVSDSQVSDSPFYYRGYTRDPDTNNLPPKNKTPYGVDEWTIYSARGDTALQFSFDSGPEFRIVAVSEQQFETAAIVNQLYKNIATVGLNAYSGAGLTSMRNLSVFVNKGKKVRLIELSPPSYPSAPNGPSCFAPDIFLDTVLDDENGIKAFIGAASEESVDITKLALSKAFCMKQGYFMDGVIADQQSWRAFWSEVAPYSLLELARIGGKEALIPAVPTLGDGTITRNVTVSALFNQGNILADSYKEEFIDYGESTQDLIATVIYRDQSSNEPFPRNTSVTIKLKDTQELLVSRRSFDLSNFVTNRTQALHYGMLLVQQRRHIRRAVEFKTFPTEAPVAPGSYIYVQMEENQWNDIHSGAVMDDGSLNIPFASETINGTYDTLIYEPGREPFKRSITYENGQSAALSAYKGKGVLFVLGSQISAKRVFRVTEVAMEEEGEVSVRAIEHPCEESGGQAKSLITRFDTALYDIS
jgi:hypothetical protein